MHLESESKSTFYPGNQSSENTGLFGMESLFNLSGYPHGLFLNETSFLTDYVTPFDFLYIRLIFIVLYGVVFLGAFVGE